MTTLVATTSGDVSHFKDARHFSSWLGLTPKEYSSGSSRYLGRISKRGDRYLRICYATLRDKEPFGEGKRLARKINRESFAMPLETWAHKGKQPSPKEEVLSRHHHNLRRD
jgi:transposase